MFIDNIQRKLNGTGRLLCFVVFPPNLHDKSENIASLCIISEKCLWSGIQRF